MTDHSAALEAAGIKVKALDWSDRPDNDPIVLSRADSLLGTYFICDDTDDFTGLYLELISHDNAKWWQHVRSTSETIRENYHGDDLAPLKATAQADYERRILSALEPTTGPSVVEAARVLLEALKGIHIYANDTLSGRTDGPDDREWQRAAVIELRDRAEAAIRRAEGRQG